MVLLFSTVSLRSKGKGDTPKKNPFNQVPMEGSRGIATGHYMLSIYVLYIMFINVISLVVSRTISLIAKPLLVH